ncbi:STAS domain-containing protein [Methylomonas methanica]|uniref:MlaB-like STAS domain-containing protein n=1 Tax=Methylomonas methanica (strain DSM 25384 / MC09) TaxID=857087 RepID=G0A6U1_METMM|nr:STAS domain-containing protein [Methylomonas methanica]AEG00562.1 hypothetical protein Metme_2157 [Methylomonas methanica MC09]
MAEQDESSMIGYDPLAWMHEAEDVDLPLQSESDPPSLPNESTNDDDEQQVDYVTETSVESVPLADMDDLSDAADNQPVGAATQCQIVLESVQNIQTVAKLHQQLQCMLDECDKIDIDASAVTQIDTASLQLLLVLKLTAIKSHKEVSIDFPSEKFMEAANLLGLSEMLSVDQAASGFF